MEVNLLEWAQLLLRWLHVITGIMWVGNSFHFMWMDRNLKKPKGSRKNLIGELWMVHSGGFYQIEKMHLEPNQMPKTLHWFRWEAGMTWISGFFLLTVIYYFGGGSFLIDPSVRNLTQFEASAIGIGILVVGWFFYDGLFLALAKNERIATIIAFVLGCFIAYGLTQTFSGRGAFIHFGALIGTLMAGNVWMRILPSQKQMIAATKAGKMADKRLGARAKGRSTHNTYMTLPLLFIMISNHYPMTYAHDLSWLILIILMIAGAAVRRYMSVKNENSKWMLATAIVSILFLAFLTRPDTPAAATSSKKNIKPVSFKTVQTIVTSRCVLCHASKPVDARFGPNPGGANLETPENIKLFAERIKFRTVTTETMPLMNKTAMTKKERELIGAWVDQGAPIEAKK